MEGYAFIILPVSLAKEEGGWKGPRSSNLSSFFFFFFFNSPFRSCLSVFWGVCWERGLGCLSPHLSVPPGIPYCHSNPRPLTGAQIRDQRISDLTCVCVRKVAKRVCVCVTEAVTSMSLCCPARNLSPRGERLEGDTSCKIQTQSSVPSEFFLPFSFWSLWQSTFTNRFKISSE